MIFENFQIAATPFIHHAYCKCGESLIEVSNGLLSKVMYCPKCENVYQLKLIKISDRKLNQDFIDQCRQEYRSHTEGD